MKNKIIAIKRPNNPYEATISSAGDRARVRAGRGTGDQQMKIWCAPYSQMVGTRSEDGAHHIAGTSAR